jgi:hypothetical protein
VLFLCAVQRHCTVDAASSTVLFPCAVQRHCTIDPAAQLPKARHQDVGQHPSTVGNGGVGGKSIEDFVFHAAENGARIGNL